MTTSPGPTPPDFNPILLVDRDPDRRHTVKGTQHALESKIKAFNSRITALNKRIEEFDDQCFHYPEETATHVEFRPIALKSNAIADTYQECGDLAQDIVSLSIDKVSAIREYQEKLDKYNDRLNDAFAYVRRITDQLVHDSLSSVPPEATSSSSSHAPNAPPERTTEASAPPTTSSSATDIGELTKGGFPADNRSIASSSTLSSTSRARLEEKKAEIRLKALEAKAAREREEQAAKAAREREEQAARAAREQEEQAERQRREQFDAQLDLQLKQAERQAYEDDAAEQFLGSDDEESRQPNLGFRAMTSQPAATSAFEYFKAHAQTYPRAGTPFTPSSGTGIRPSTTCSSSDLSTSTLHPSVTTVQSVSSVPLTATVPSASRPTWAPSRPYASTRHVSFAPAVHSATNYSFPPPPLALNPTATPFQTSATSSTFGLGNGTPTVPPPSQVGPPPSQVGPDTSTQWLQALLYKPSDSMKFDGKPQNFLAFINLFEHTIGNNVQDPVIKLKELLAMCTPDIRGKLQHCQMLEPNEGLSQAIQILWEDYGSPEGILDSVLSSLRTGSVIGRTELSRLREHYRSVQSAHSVLNALTARSGGFHDYSAQANTRDLISDVLSRTPYFINDYSAMYPGLGGLQFSNLVNFLAIKTQNAKDPVAMAATEKAKSRGSGSRARGRGGFAQAPTRPSTSGTSFLTGGEESKKQFQCICCNNNAHPTFSCKKFLDLSEKDRFDKLYRAYRCLNCGSTHFSRECKEPRGCKETGCPVQIKHSVLVHSGFRKRSKPSGSAPEAPPKKMQSQETKKEDENKARTGADRDEIVVESNSLRLKRSGTFLNVVPIKVTNDNGDSVSTFAFLDPCSDYNFIAANVAKMLKLSGKKSSTNLSTAIGSKPYTSEVVSASIAGIENETQVFGKVQMRPIDSDRLSGSPTPVEEDMCAAFPHLAHRFSYDVDVPRISVLIGGRGPQAFLHVVYRSHISPSGLVLHEGPLGVSIIGSPAAKIDDENGAAYFLHADLDQDLHSLWQNESCPSLYLDKKEMSHDDRTAFKAMEESTVFKDGHYEVKPPWREWPPSLTSNRSVVLQRFRTLHNKFTKNPDYFAKYSEVMQSYIQNGYAERVPHCELRQPQGLQHYLPHHSVSHPRKDLRVVFDTSLKINGQSLNTATFSGPDVLNSLIGVLLRFRQYEVPVSSDLKAFYHCVRLPKEDKDLFRFFWYADPKDPSSPIVEWRFTVHVFGGIASQSCCVHALFTALRDAAARGIITGEEAERIRRTFYSDDNLRSFRSVDEAVLSMKTLVDLLKTYGFNLTKLASPNQDFLRRLPQEMLHPDLTDHSLLGKSGSALGVQWSYQYDYFYYDFPKQSKRDELFTKRSLLSALASIYDPLGLIGFALVPAKITLQTAFRVGCDWDQFLPDELQRDAQRWILNLSKLGEFRIPRAVTILNATSVQLHLFSDSSSICYAAVAFLRTQDANGRLQISLLASRNRLGPIKGLSVPRMELNGALLAARLANLVHLELELKINSTHFWIDSTAVLNAIRNKTTRYQTFVARRLQEIQDTTSIQSWQYVPTSINVADGISRGLFPKDFKGHPYLLGPDFLRSDPIQWPQEPNILATFDKQEELKKQNPGLVMQTSETEPSFAKTFFPKFGRLYKLKVSVAWLKRFISYLAAPTSTPTGPITVDEMNTAELDIVRLVQYDEYSDVIDRLKAGMRIQERHRLAKFNPILTDGVLRVGGRLRHAPDVSFDVKHPMILPPSGHVTHLVITDVHQNLIHGSARSTVNQLRSKFWFPKMNRTVKNILYKCVLCRKLDSPFQGQMMADLPTTRTKTDHPPFEVTGADLFGTFGVRIGRSSHKRWVALFTCHSSRAVHLEPIFSLEADSFINAVRRLQARRGQVKCLNLDNATNNRSSDKLLSAAIREWNSSDIGQRLRQHGIDFHFNPPRASHFGGVFESMIRLCRRPLSLVLEEQKLNDETFHTLLTEVEAVINSRPLVPITDDPDDFRALTPSDLLVVRPSSTLPPGIFTEKDRLRRKWRQIQHLCNIFWKRFLAEYLPLLNKRQKWLTPKRNLRVGDLVLMKEDNVPRGFWPLGRITDVKVSPDQLVRSVSLKTSRSSYTRPVHKVILLEASE